MVSPDTQGISTYSRELAKDTVVANDREANIQCGCRIEEHRLAQLPRVKSVILTKRHELRAWAEHSAPLALGLLFLCSSETSVRWVPWTC